jgi:SNF2 family DNA or RNA helicase
MFLMTPKEHQQQCFDFVKDSEYSGILLPMGTGKSAILLAKAVHLYKLGKINGLLIFSNKGSYATWDTEQIPLHLHTDIPRQVVRWDASTNKKKVNDFKLLYNGKKELKILIINIEAISTKRSAAIAEATKFLRSLDCLMCIDESSTIKNLSSSRTGNAIDLGMKAKYRVIMTGSSITNSPLDIWAQSQFLDPLALGFKSFYAFRASFCELEKSFIYQKGERRDFIAVSGFKRLNDLRDILNRFCFIRTKEQCLDLPPKIYQKYIVEMSKEQAEAYKKFKEEAIMSIKDSTVSATVVLAQITKLRQIACGYVKSDDGKIHYFNSSRVDALLEILEEINDKVLIWTPFVPCIKAIEKRIQEVYGLDSVVSYYGETSGEDRPEQIKKFKTNEECRFFVGNPAVGGYGVNLTEACYAVYFNNDYSLDKRDQSEDRCHRIGQTKSVIYIDMLAKGTLDFRVLSVLRDKKDVQQMILGDRESAIQLLDDNEVF